MSYPKTGGARRSADLDLDLDRAAPARVYNYLLGGRLNYAIDRHFGNQILGVLPTAREICEQNQKWMARVVRFGVAQGIRQFLDIGSGMPTEGHVHQTAQSAAPESRVVYAESEPVAVAHSQLILEGNDRAAMVHAALGRPWDVLEHPTTLGLIDFDQPVMVIAGSVVQFTPDERDLAEFVAQYRGIIAPGSYLALSAFTGERQGEELFRAIDLFQAASCPIYLRGRDDLLALMADLDLVEPGVVFTREWRPDDPADVGKNPERAAILTVVGRKR